MRGLYNIRRFWEISSLEKKLFINGFFFSGYIRMLITCLPMKYYVHYIKSASFVQNDKRIVTNDYNLVHRTVNRIAKITPWKCTCLVKAIACRYLLASLGMHSFVLLTIRKSGKNLLIAHATIKLTKSDGDQKHPNCFKIAI